MARKKKTSVEEPATQAPAAQKAAPAQAPVKNGAPAAAQKQPEAKKPVEVVPEPTEEAPTHKKTRRGGANKKKNTAIVETTAPPSKKQSTILKEAEATIRSCPKQVESSHRAELNQTIRTLESAMASEIAKRPKVKSIRQSSRIQREVDELRNIDDMKDFMEEKKEELSQTIAWEAYQAFKIAAQALVEKAEEMAKQSGPPSQDVINKERLVQKLSVVKKIPVAKISADDVKQRQLDVSSEALVLMGPPNWLSRRYEKEFGVAIEMGGKGRGKGVSGRGIAVIGYDEDLDEAVAKLNNLDFSVCKKVTLKPNELSKVIGPGGKTIRDLEKQCDALLIVNVLEGTPNKEIVIHGSTTGVSEAIQAIEAKQSEVQAEGKTANFTYKGEKAGFLFKDNGASRKKEILAEHEVTLRMQNGDHQTEFVFKGKSDDTIAHTKEKLFKYIDGLHEKNVETTEEKLTKFFKTPDLRQQYDRLVTDEKHCCMFVRKVSSITLISDDAEKAASVAEKINGFIAFASFEPIYVPILREQARVFHRENCEEVGYRSGCTVQLYFQELKLCVKGSEEQLAKAKKYIQEIIDREGSVESMELSEAVCQQLMSRGFAQKREIEDACIVSLNVDKAACAVTFVGSKIGNKRAKEMIEDLEKLEKQMETKLLTIKVEEIPRIIGTRGANLRTIRDVCPTVTVVDGEESGSAPTVTLRGTPNQIEEAEKMIEDLCHRDDDEEVYVEEKPVEKKKPQVKASSLNFASDDLFPTLATVTKPKKMRGKGKGKGKGKVEEAKEPSEEEFVMVEKEETVKADECEEVEERTPEVNGN